MSFGTYLKKLREEKGLGLNQLSLKSGVSSSQISRLENGKMGTPKVSTIKKLAVGLRTDELELLAKAGYLPETSKMPKNMKPVDSTKLVSIPVVGTIKAGPNGLALQDFQGTEFVMADDIEKGYEYYWLTVSGDSMIGDGIYDGDYALIKKTVSFNNGDICAIIVDGEEGTLKHINRSDNSIILTGSNPVYPPRLFTGKDMNQIMIGGKLVRTMRKY
ncbi:S24 family peptidase [Pediococcus pentosaceus]|uniref:LexA family protein n=1 Tax=Pediococcus pentosaceus TaxID=1255 RepID=UPI0026587834|nr:S24 family peptidase [Pediococcus pentosaceus]WKF70505.1 S24 family peptidase [Pediococcus pentosaceus]